MTVKVEDTYLLAEKRAIADIAYLMEQEWSMREKSLWLKTIELLHNMEYYNLNRSVFRNNEDKEKG